MVEAAAIRLSKTLSRKTLVSLDEQHTRQVAQAMKGLLQKWSLSASGQTAELGWQQLCAGKLQELPQV